MTVLVGFLGILVGLLGGFYFERWRLRKKFLSPYYDDLWMVIQNVHGSIRRRRVIRNEIVMKSIQDKYSCQDIQSYIQNCFRTKDKKLRELLDKFVSNMSDYRISIQGKPEEYDPTTGILPPPDHKTVEQCQELSDNLTNRIEKRVTKLIVK